MNKGIELIQVLIDCCRASELSGLFGDAPYHIAENSLALHPDKVMEVSNICIKGFASIKAFLIMALPLIFADIFKIFPCKSQVPEMVVSLVTDVAEAFKDKKTRKNKSGCFMNGNIKYLLVYCTTR